MSRPPRTHPAYLSRPAHQVFPQDIDCVYQPSNGKGGIYIGNLEAAENIKTLQKHRIGALLTACKNIHIRHPKEEIPYTLYIPGEDHQAYDLSLHFSAACDFIGQSRKETNILVHCMAGISRSATLVIAYLMKCMDMPFTQAMDTIVAKRKKINPNPGFLRQLQAFQRQVSSRHKTKQSFTSVSRDKQPTGHQHPPCINSYGQLDYQHLSVHKQPSKNWNFWENSEYTPTGKRCNPETFADNGRDYNPNSKAHQINQSRNYVILYQKGEDQRRTEPFGNRSNFTENTGSCSVQSLGRDLDERIARIKDKYYEQTTLEQKLPERSPKLGGNMDRILSSFGAFELSRSRGHDSQGGNVYNYCYTPKPPRPVTFYNYQSFI